MFIIEIMSYFVFSDIDGTLLNHNNYSFGNLENYIKAIKNNVSLIFNTSKTFSEVTHINKKLSLNAPFIVENGACIFFPLGYIDKMKYGSQNNFFTYKKYIAYKITNLTSEDIISMISKLKKLFNFSFYSELSNEQVMECTNLEVDCAKRSKKRLFTNPILWRDSIKNIKRFKSEIKKINNKLTVLKGGRFIHISDSYDKGVALKKFIEVVKPFINGKLITVSLGDSENDISMLESTDYSCIVKREKNKITLKKKKNIYFSQTEAPNGWKESLDYVLKMENQDF